MFIPFERFAAFHHGGAFTSLRMEEHVFIIIRQHNIQCGLWPLELPFKVIPILATSTQQNTIRDSFNAILPTKFVGVGIIYGHLEGHAKELQNYFDNGMKKLKVEDGSKLDMCHTYDKCLIYTKLYFRFLNRMSVCQDLIPTKNKIM